MGGDEMSCGVDVVKRSKRARRESDATSASSRARVRKVSENVRAAVLKGPPSELVRLGD